MKNRYKIALVSVTIVSLLIIAGISCQTCLNRLMSIAFRQALLLNCRLQSPGIATFDIAKNLDSEAVYSALERILVKRKAEIYEDLLHACSGSNKEACIASAPERAKSKVAISYYNPEKLILEVNRYGEIGNKARGWRRLTGVLVYECAYNAL